MPSTRINLLQIALITFDLFVHFLQLVRFFLKCIYGTQAATGDKVAGLRPSILLKIRLVQVFSYEFWENCLPTPKLTLIQPLTLTRGPFFSRAIVSLPPILKLTLPLAQTLILTGGGQFSLGDGGEHLSGYHFRFQV